MAMTYESYWRQYAYNEQGPHFYSLEEMKKTLMKEELGGMRQHVSGIPLIKEGDTVFVSNRDDHAIVFGQTASKKSRAVVIPAIVSHAYAGRSMIITDVKGELCTNPKVIGLLRDQGYAIRYVDFRTFKADGYNVFAGAFKAYRRGDPGNAFRIFNSVISSLVLLYSDSSVDKFWGSMAGQHLMGCVGFLLPLFALNKGYEKYMNMSTLACLTDEQGTQVMERIVNSYLNHVNNNYLQMLRNVLSAPDKTRSSIVATSAAIMRDFMVQEDLMNMLSNSTFQIEDLYERQAAVFLIIPDEVSTYDTIAGFLMDGMYEQLVSYHALRFSQKKAPCDIAWVCDEVCNLMINDMRAKISASRSRQMRWLLICQSKKQLEDVYRENAATIIGNCRNKLFLQSSDMDMLRYISECTGTIPCESGSEPLATVEMLQNLKKSKEGKEAVYLSDNVCFKADLADFDQYECLKKFAGVDAAIPVVDRGRTSSYTPGMLAKDLSSGKIRLPW